jgi:hypothetical protein
MKRLLIVGLLLLATVTLCVAQDHIWIDRVQEDGRLLVPLRGIFDHYGAELGWHPDTRAVTIEAPALNVSMQVDDHNAMLNGEMKTLDVPPRIIDGRTHVPLRFVAEALGERVKYEGDRVDMPTMGLTLLIRGEASGPQAEQYDAPAGTVTITRPTEGAMIGPRVEVRGTAPGGSFLVIDTEVRAQDDDELIKVVPGIRNDVPESGNWHFAIAAPSLPMNLRDEALYYVIRAYTPSGGPSQAAKVKVFRPDE